MAGIDLTGARRRVSERVFTDRITVARNPRTSAPAEIDDDSGIALVNPDDDATVIATDVPCVIRESNLLEREVDSKVVKRWEISCDYDLAPDFELGDECRITTSSDPELQGGTLFVYRVVTGTLRVSRKVEATRSFDGTSKH